MNNKKIIAMIPARIGSQRLKFKNLALIGKYPLIYFVINAAKKSNIFDKIVINSDHKVFQKISNRYKIDFYLRPKLLGKSNIKSDNIVYDFINKHKNYDTLVWINPIAPLLTENNIRDTINFFVKNKLHSLITSDKAKVHANIKSKPINYNKKTKLVKTQSLEAIELFNYSIMMWNTKKFLKSYEKNKHAFFCGKFSTYELPRYCSIIIKNKNDLLLASKFIKMKSYDEMKITYDNILNEKN